MIKSRALAEFLVTVYGKAVDDISTDDIEMVAISNKDLNGEFCEFYPEDLLMFKNLKGINFDSAVLSVSDIESLKQIPTLKQVGFKSCAFEDESTLGQLTGITDLSMNGTFVEDYSFLKQLSGLKTLQIVAPPTEAAINLENLAQIDDLSALVLDTCIIENPAALNNKKIEYLSLLMTEIPNSDVSFIDTLGSLKKLYVNEEYGPLISRTDIEVRHDLINETFDKEL